MTDPPLLDTTRVLTLRDIHVDREGHVALRGVDADAHAGRLLAVAGANGSGKSTLLDVAAGLLQPQRGTVRRRDDLRIALLPQTTALPPHLPLTVTDVVSMGTWARLGPWRRARRSDRAAVADAIDAVELRPHATRRIGALSGGQRQRALLAQALVQRADLVLLDEPMAGLDTRSRRIIADAVDRLTADGAAVIAVTHDLSEFRRADEVLTLHEGSVTRSAALRKQSRARAASARA
ncbi:zinc ABC transporter ATP-binding protein AztA [Microbacterium sp.]|uniref:zinc ABC transporter ATP-binding protein AztA n=1 Tax=Microbacterium sp. TaxID=51671 RepID=UPI002810F88E|nr:zinc ABC transporter ATP-binding protein AztA [Microbacterium sp.]